MEKYLNEARKILSDYFVLFAYDYGDYYYFNGIYKSEKNNPVIRNGVAIRKKDCKKKDDWNSVNLVLDTLIKEIDITSYLSDEEKIIAKKCKETK